MDGMKHYLIHTNFNGTPEFHSYWADDEDHAIEQLDDSTDEYNVSQYITHIFVSDTEILNNNVAQRLWITDKEKDRVHDEHCTRLDWLCSLKVGDYVFFNDYNVEVQIVDDFEGIDNEMSSLVVEDGKQQWCINGYDISPISDGE